jgi:MFS family permease
MLRKYLLVFLLTFSNIVYLIPYLATDFYNQFLEAYGLTDGELGMLITMYGATAVPGYFIGGWLADRFNPKTMVALSCILTAAVAVGVAFVPNYTVLLVLHLLYGVTSNMLNWGAYLKLIRMLGEDEQQGRLYGSADICYGLFSLILEYTIIALTMNYMAEHPMGFKLTEIIYAGLSTLIGILIWRFVPKIENKKLDDNEDTIRFKYIARVLKMPLTWYLSLFTLGYFITRSTMPYLNPYLTDAFGVSVAMATAIVVTFRSVSLMAFSPFGGWIRDRMGRSTPLVMLGSIVALAGSLVMAYIPMYAAFSLPLMIVGMAVLVFNSLMTNCLYTPVSEGKVTIALTGTILGVASAIGYSSDIWLYSLCGYWLDTMSNYGYQNIWCLQAGACALMVVSGLLLYREYKKVRAVHDANEAIGEAAAAEAEREVHKP